MNISKINNIEAVALLSIIMANKIILNLPESIISSTGSSAWINVIYILAIAFIFVFVCTKLMKNFPEHDIIDISEYIGGSFFKTIFSVLQIFILIIVINVVIRNFSDTIKTIYFTQSPIIFITLFLVISAAVANKFGLKTISKICIYIAPLAFIGLSILLLVPAKDFEIHRLLPILGYGINETFFKGLTSLFALSGLGYIFLLPPILKSHKDLKKITVISLSISGLFLFFSTICMLLIFSFYINANENMSLYLLTMVVHHSNLIHAVNTLFLLVWILSIISYISITLYFILYIIKKVGRLSDTSSINYSIVSTFIALSLILQNYTPAFAVFRNIAEYSVLIFVFILEPLLLIIANIKQKIKNQNTKQVETTESA